MKYLFSSIIYILILTHLKADASANPLSFPPLFFSIPEEPVENKSVYYAVGPLFEYTSDNSGYRAAIHPIWSREKKKDYFAEDIIWPLFTRRVLKDEWNWRFLLFYNSGFNEREPKRDRNTFIPIWFSGKDDKNQFYWALFPVYGTAKYLLSYDSIYWILFPLYLETKKGPNHGKAYLWPIVNWDTGPRFDKFRVFPFYAYHHRFGNSEYRSIMWPLWHDTKSFNPKVPGGGWLLWPLIGHTEYKNPDRSAWSFIWPLFQIENTKYPDGKKGVGINCPWPVFQYKNKIRNWYMQEGTSWQLYIWPLWGRRKKPHSDYSFYLWPLGSTQRIEEEGAVTEWLWALPLYFSKNAWDFKGNKEETYRHYWPFASYYKDKEKCVIRALDINPFRNFPVIQRNWDPLWRLFHYVETKRGVHYDILWGMCSSTQAEYKIPEDEGRKAKEDCFGIYPFYEQLHLENTVKGNESTSKLDITRYFMGLIQTTTHNKNTRLRLFWCIDL